MSSETTIWAEGLGKRYRIGAVAERRSDTLRDAIIGRVDALRRWRRCPSDAIASGRAARHEEVWALKDVSFEVKRGEVLGVIGRNGAGKSTLLKVLSRITEPTEGHARIQGRVASLLEVGVAFHPELTGRENIYVNGAILGMKRAEIARRFDEIVAFAEVEKFIDTPVKRYSSGMYVRLAFGVAAHLEPEILIVDEVLAVGDAEFQKKCLGKMRAVSTEEGRTVLFVSHNTEAVCSLCSRCLLLQEGRLTAVGDTTQVVTRYLGTNHPVASAIDFGSIDSDAQFRSAQLCDSAERVAACFSMHDPVTVRFRFAVRRRIAGLQVALAILNFKGERLFYSSNETTGPMLPIGSVGCHEVNATIPSRVLLPGRYFVNIALHRPNVALYDLREQALSFEVVRPAGEYHGFSSADLGFVNVDVRWDKKNV